MELELVLDIGNSRIKGGFFEEKRLISVFSIDSHPLPKEELMRYLEGKSIRRALIASVNKKADEGAFHVLVDMKINTAFLEYAQLKLALDVDEPNQLGHDRIANAYGALAVLPLNDSIIVDIGAAITLDFVTKEGHYLGGMIYPGPTLCSKALATYTDKLPLVAMRKPDSPLGKTTKSHLEGGIYYGQLGAIERMIAELRTAALSPSSVKVVATGGFTKSPSTDGEPNPFLDDLNDIVDIIEPHLTLVGLHEILNEE